MIVRYVVFLFAFLVFPSWQMQSQEKNISEEEFQVLVDQLDYSKTKKALRIRDKFVPKDLEPDEEKTPDSSGAGGALLHILAYGLMGFLVVLIIYMIFSNVQLDKKLDKDEMDLDEITDLGDIDADAAYQAAIARGDYRLAIRMQFIKCLQTLSAAGHIEWEKEKTNRDYTREIKDREMKRSFRELASLFEYTWYGDVDVDTQLFRVYDKRFVDFFNVLQ